MILYTGSLLGDRRRQINPAAILALKRKSLYLRCFLEDKVLIEVIK